MSSRLYKCENSLIAVLDILGISSMMRNAQVKDLPNLASNLESAFSYAQEYAQKIIATLDKRENKYFSIQRFFKIQVFSDTVVICCNFNKIQKEVSVLDRQKIPEYYLLAFGFFVCVKAIAGSLFRDGYPTRGCISVGPIISTKNFIIGKPFIDSITHANNLNVAGIIVLKTAKIVYDCILKSQYMQKQAPIELHMVPYKNSRPKKTWCLNFLEHPIDRFLILNIESFFSKHGKIVTEDATEKIKNTKKLFQAFFKKLST